MDSVSNRMDKADPNLRTLTNVTTNLEDLIVQVSHGHFQLTKEITERKELMTAIANILAEIDSVQNENRMDRDIKESLTKEAIKMRDLVDTLTLLVEGKLTLLSGFPKSGSDLEMQIALMKSIAQK